MSAEYWISILGLAATTLLVVVGLMNFSIFRRQLEVAHEQIDTAVHQLEITRKQPDLHLIQRAIAETSDHVRVIVERPYLRKYFYDNVPWQSGDEASQDEVLAMGELMLNNFASALMHSAAFPEYPVRGIDRSIMFHFRQSPTLRRLLPEMFDRFPFTGLSLLCYMNESRESVVRQLEGLIAAEADDEEIARRKELLRILQESDPESSPLDYTTRTMQKRR